jgi:hypothetical protein
VTMFPRVLTAINLGFRFMRDTSFKEGRCEKIVAALYERRLMALNQKGFDGHRPTLQPIFSHLQGSRKNGPCPLLCTAVVLLACLYTGCISRYQRSNGEIILGWSNALASLQVKAKGDLEFTGDETDVRSISPQGYLLIQERRGLTVRKLEAVPGPDGTITRSYSFRGRPHEFDVEARAWLARTLPEVIRETGIGASTRAQKLLWQRGAAGLLEEISRLKSDRVKRLYFQVLFQSGNLSPQDLEQAARQVSQQISSDGEKANLLMEMVDPYLQNETVLASFFEAVESIASDGERAAVLSGILARKDLSREVLIETLQSAAKIASDGEKTGVLLEAAKPYPVDDAVLSEYLSTTATISSDGEKSTALSALLKREDLSDEILVKILNTAATISSDGEKAAVLETTAKVCPNSETVLSAYLATAGSVSSDGERGRILTAFLSRGDLSQNILKEALESAAAIASDGEKATVLAKAAKLCSNDETLLSAFLAATETISSDGEYRRVMSTLMTQIKPRAIVRSKG